jgi:HTH-type transcriptional repressor of puuD
MQGREIGTRLRQIRLARGLRMEDVANAAGIAQSTLSYIERGSDPGVDTLRRILDALGVSWTEFFGEDPATESAASTRQHDDEGRPIPESDLDAYLRQHDLWFKGKPLTYAEKLAARQAIELLRTAMQASEGEEDAKK